MSTDIRRESLNNLERKTIVGVISGTRNPNSKRSSKVLQRPRVAVALEHILNQAGLSDSSLAKRIKEIIEREETISHNKLGGVSTNVTGIDANALNAIRTIWQVKGRFTDKDKGSLEGLKGLTEEQLDGIITNGVSITNIQKTTIERTKDGPLVGITDTTSQPTIRR